MLKIEQLSKRYGNSSEFAINNINLTIHQGEFIAILGASGAGKSTFIRCLNRFVQPSSGRILWDNQDIMVYGGQALRSYRRQFGMIFQQFNLIERMSVLNNVLVGRFGALPLRRILTWRIPESDLKSANDALKIVDMASHASRRVSELSGGQRQRVAIARAIVQEPRVLLGDEPVASLDPVTSTRVMTLLDTVRQEEGITMLINLHSVELAKHYATRIIGICKGEVVFDGRPSELDERALETIYPTN